MHHQFGGAHLRISARDRKLDALVLPDRPAEYRTLFGVIARLLDEPFAVADAFRRDQDALGIHARENVAEALAFFADQVFSRYPEIIKENFRRRVIHHGADRIDLEALASRFHVDEK